MSATILSDLSQMLLMRRDTVRVRNDLSRAMQEVSSGKKAELGKAVSGNYGPLAAIDQQISTLRAYQTNADEAALFVDSAQVALNQINQLSSEYGIKLANTKESEIVRIGNVLAIEGRAAFELSFSALNARAGGRSVFAGAATDQPAVAKSEDVLAALKLEVAGETTANGVIQRVEDWFAANFDTTVYLGSTNDVSGFQAGDGREIGMKLKANDPAIREQLKILAVAAVLNDSGITDPTDHARLAHLTGEALISNEPAMIALQAGVGVWQERVELARTQNSAEKAALDMARNRIVGADPYESATNLTNLQAQLETIYTVTARLSGLSLTNYLR